MEDADTFEVALPVVAEATPAAESPLDTFNIDREIEELKQLAVRAGVREGKDDTWETIERASEEFKQRVGRVKLWLDAQGDAAPMTYKEFYDQLGISKNSAYRWARIAKGLAPRGATKKQSGELANDEMDENDEAPAEKKSELDVALSAIERVRSKLRERLTDKDLEKIRDAAEALRDEATSILDGKASS